MDGFIEFLFKYRPFVFEKGHIILGASWPARIVVLLVGVLAIAAVATYTRVRFRGSSSDRFVLGGIRVLALALLIFAVLQPVLLVSAAISQRNVVGVVIDDSHSMQVADMGGRTRADIVRSLFGGPDSSVYKALAKKFVVRLFRVGGGGSRVDQVADIAFDGARTRLAPALEGVRQELTGAPLAGLVLASDGVDNTPGSLDESLVALNARHVPVFTVGIGQEQFAKDIEITRIEAPRSVLKGTAVVMSVDITQRGYGGNTVQLVVEDEGRMLSTEAVTLPSDGEAKTVRIRVPATEAGARLLTVRIAPQPNEMVKENNAQVALVVVRERKDKILYVEGEPRFELKFLRSAVDDDENLQLVTMMRTSKDKFLRLSVDNSGELANGFPQTREELFKYQAIVLGSIEASYFTFEQLQMISDFVSQRGGGLLMLGGRSSFSEGGYAGTPVAEALPVELSTNQRGKPEFHEVKVGVTDVGAVSSQTFIAGSENASTQRWKKMPTVTSVNRVTRVKAGATMLLDGAAPKGGERMVVLAHQYFGRGKTMAFPVEDSWLWKMSTDVPVGDPTYQTFWRQTLRWLVNDVPSRVTASASADRAWVNEPLHVDVQVADQEYQNVKSADVKATIHTPSGAVVEQPLESSSTRDGVYQLVYVPAERGTYRIQIDAHPVGDTIVSAEPVFVDVGAPSTEYIGAEMRSSLLQRIAERTGGQYYTPASASNLAKDLVYAGGGNTAMDRLDLWNMPIILLLLLLLLIGEWGYRRMRGLV